MAVGAACWWHNDPATLSVYEVAHEVVREVVTPRFSHRDFVPQTSDSGVRYAPRIFQGIQRTFVQLGRILISPLGA
jgi:hypothetical protein